MQADPTVPTTLSAFSMLTDAAYGTDTNPYISTGVTATQAGTTDEWQYSPTARYQSLALFKDPDGNTWLLPSLSPPGTGDEQPAGMDPRPAPSNIEPAPEGGPSTDAFVVDPSSPPGTVENPYVVPGVTVTRDPASGTWAYTPTPPYQSVGLYVEDSGIYWVLPELEPAGTP